jgi:membrane-associated phospholipid phosphatase
MLNLMRVHGHYQRAARRIRRAIALTALTASPMATLQAQATDAGSSSLLAWEDARLLGFVALATAAAMPLDRDGQRVMQRRWVQDAPLFARGADLFNAYGSPGVLAGSAVLYAAGWATGRPAVARLGVRAAEVIVLSGVVTASIKGIAGRTRPAAHPGAPGDFRWMAGVSDEARQSFPSGHTTAAFAFAGALHHELRRMHSPRARLIVPALYAAAALTGLARMHADKHWASDVVMGAGVGLVSSQVVARYHAGRPGHWLDRRLLPRRRP